MLELTVWLGIEPGLGLPSHGFFHGIYVSDIARAQARGAATGRASGACEIEVLGIGREFYQMGRRDDESAACVSPFSAPGR